MHIFLYGPSGTGKSTIGQVMARNLKLPFIDLDKVIETNAGTTIPQIMETQGESAFRDLESAALKSINSPLPSGEGLGVRESVVALGGGALLRDENRAFAESNGKVILLTAKLDTLLQRLNNDANKRPLLAGDLRDKLISMLAKRGEHYGSFPLQIRVDEKSAEQSAHQAQVVLGRHHLSAMGEYDVRVDQASSLIYANIIVTDENVAKFHLEKMKAVLQTDKSIVIPAGEEHKNLQTISALWKAFLENGLDRKSTVVALGGGVLSDMT
ncbi:MAG: shikimate kinase, partial [Anaerolineales bacterium]|nr:shikimate kinase [Anaerolineales bacterium]